MVVIGSDTALQVKEGYNLALMSGCASGAAVTPADGSVPAGFEPPSAPGYRGYVRVCWVCVRVWWCVSSVWRVPKLLGQSRLR